MDFFENMPMDILLIIVRYVPAESIMLSEMSKKLRKAVVKSGFSVSIMQLFFANKYGYIFPLKDIRISRPYEYYTEEFCLYMYEYDEPIKYACTDFHPKYIKKCLEKGDIDNISIMSTMCRNPGSGDIKDIFSKFAVKSGKIHYEITRSEQLDINTGKQLIRSGLKSYETDIILNGYQEGFMYEAFLVGNYELSDKIWEYVKRGLFTREIRKMIKHDDVVLFNMFIERYNIDLTIRNISIPIRQFIYQYDAIKIYEHVRKKAAMFFKGTDVYYNSLKIFQFNIKNDIRSYIDFNLFYPSSGNMWEIYIPNSKAFKMILTIEAIYSSIKFDPKYIQEHSKKIIRMYNATLITPHSHKFVNTLFDDLAKLC